jgi:hypothetical protein
MLAHLSGSLVKGEKPDMLKTDQQLKLEKECNFGIQLILFEFFLNIS